MVVTRSWLADKFALVKLTASPDRAAWRQRIEQGLVHVTSVTLMEIAFSARSASDMTALLHQPPLANMPIEYITPAVEERALEVLEALAARGQHRAPSVPDLLIAAVAERTRLTVLHVDKDFDLIAEITGQPVEWLLF